MKGSGFWKFVRDCSDGDQRRRLDVIVSSESKAVISSDLFCCCLMGFASLQVFKTLSASPVGCLQALKRCEWKSKLVRQIKMILGPPLNENLETECLNPILDGDLIKKKNIQVACHIKGFSLLYIENVFSCLADFPTAGDHFK